MRASRRCDFHSHCLRCRFRLEICVCPVLPTVHTQTEFLVLRHVWEATRSSNTGRLVDLAMPNARIVSCGGGLRIGESAVNEDLLTAPGTWLLWPDATGAKAHAPQFNPPKRVVVIDATWHQARRLYRHMEALQSLPKLSLPLPDADRLRLRRQRRPDGMSTLEAVAAAVALLEGAHRALPLEALYDEVVLRAKTLRWGKKPIQ